MAKISALPMLAEPTGAEILPVVAGGETRGARLQPLVDLAARPHVEAAELAAATAAGFVSGIMFSSTAAALPLVTEGAYFSVAGDDTGTYAILYRKVAGAAVEQARYASKAAYEGPTGAGLIGSDTGAPAPFNIVQSAQQKFEGDKDMMDWLNAYERNRARLNLPISDVAPLFADYCAHMEAKQKFGILRQSGGRLPFSTGVTLNAQRVQLRLAGIWSFNGAPAGTNCVTIRAPTTEGRDGRGEKRAFVQGLNIDGNGFAAGSVGIKLEDCDNLILDQWFVRDIDTGVACGLNVYCNRLSGGAVTVAKQGVIVHPSGNTGERIMINDTTFASCTTGLVVNSAIADLMAHQVSIDYPRDWTGDLTGTAARFVSVLAGRMSLSQCHLEGNGPFDRMGAISAMYVSPDSSARLRIAQTEMLFSDNFANYAIEQLNDFDYCRPEWISMLKCAGANGFLYYGNVVPTSTGMVDGVSTNGPFFSAAQNLMMDGSFASSLRDASITEGANQNGPLTADSIVLTRSDAARRPGEKSINARIIGGPSTGRRWCLRVPIGRGDGVVPGSRIWMRNIDASGVLYLSQFFVAGHDGPDGRFERSGRQAGSGYQETIDLGALGGNWTEKVMGGYSYRAPPWATHIEIDFNLVNAAAGSFQVTDCMMGYSR